MTAVGPFLRFCPAKSANRVWFMKNDSKSIRGISLRGLNYLMTGFALLVSVLLLLATYRIAGSYRVMRVNTEKYIACRQSAYDMQTASDYLTEQVRCFAVTGEREYLRNYFEEVNVTRRRDEALGTLGGFVGRTAAYLRLEAAMARSEELTAREYYSMLLTISAYGYDISEFPDTLQELRLTDRDAALTRDGQAERARQMVFDDVYRQQKEAITANISLCLNDLSAAIEDQQVLASDQLSRLLIVQRSLIVTTIIIVLFIVLLTALLIIRPLMDAVRQIHAGQFIPVGGSREFRFLARTYNRMFEASREHSRQLEYEASHDKLTDLYNRSGYDYWCSHLDLSICALLVIDIDKFKSINDVYGHDVGDRVLVETSNALKNSFRSDDCLCRIGGDEFVVIMIRTGRELRSLIERKIHSINELLQHPDGDLPPVSLSVGAAFGAPGLTSSELVKNADDALYTVKNGGRAGCAFYDDIR